MRPGHWQGQLRTDWLISGWERVVQHDRNCPWGYAPWGGELISPPDGFLSDLGSVPWVFWAFLPRDQFKSAYIIHDYLYSYQFTSREAADYILDESIYTMSNADATVRRWFITRGLALGGWKAWRDHQNETRKVQIRAMKALQDEPSDCQPQKERRG